jgi:hypothetical protein
MLGDRVRWFRTLGIAAVAAGALAVPASAHAKNAVNAHAYYEASLYGQNQLMVAYQCTIGSNPPAASASIRCWVSQNTGQSTAPGPVAVFGGGEIIANQPFSLCWAGSARFLDGETVHTSGCTERAVQLVGWGQSYHEGA